MKQHLYQINILVPDASLVILVNKWLEKIFRGSLPREIRGLKLLSERTQIKDQDLILYFGVLYPLQEEGKEISIYIHALFERDKNIRAVFHEWRKRSSSKDHFFYIQSYKKVEKRRFNIEFWLKKIKNLFKLRIRKSY